MEASAAPPQNPAGAFTAEPVQTPARRAELIAEIGDAPARLRKAVAGLDDSQLDTKYRNWTIRQIVHHLADSHIQAYVRFKWALTENQPLIKAYDESLWSALPDARTGPIDGPLTMFAGAHQCWVELLTRMTSEQFDRAFDHPESRKTIKLSESLASYAWHSRHHTAMITWIRQQRGW